MKRLLSAIAVVFSVSSFTASANDITGNPDAVRTFQKTFADAKSVTWSSEKNLYKADFLLNDQHATAFFNEAGELIATGRRLTREQLPIFLQISLKTKAEGFAITDVLEVTNEEGIHYYATLESATKTLMIKSDSNKNWNTYKKLKK
jgi:hypothetical protein